MYMFKGIILKNIKLISLKIKKKSQFVIENRNF